MDKFFDRFFDSINNGEWLVVFLLVAFAIIWKIRSISEFLEQQAKKRETYIQDALKIDTLSPASKSIFTDALNDLIFKKITGISADKTFREKALSIIEKSKGEIQIHHIAHARKHLKVENEKMIVELKRGDWIENKFNWLLVILMVLFSMLIILQAINLNHPTFYQFFLLFAVGIASFFFAMFVVSQTIPYSVAKKIKPRIDNIESAAIDTSQPQT